MKKKGHEHHLVLKCCICQKEMFVFNGNLYKKGDNFNYYVCNKCSGENALNTLYSHKDKRVNPDRRKEKRKKEDRRKENRTELEYDKALMFVNRIIK